VITFYHDFRRRRRGTTCSSCAAPKPARRWAAARWKRTCAAARRRHGRDLGDGRLSWNPSTASATARSRPSLLLDGELKGRVDVRRLDSLLANVKAGKAAAKPMGARLWLRQAGSHARDHHRLRAGRQPRRCRWAPMRSPRRSRDRGRTWRRGPDRAQRLARHVWLEPLVEVVTPQGRIAYGPVGARRRAPVRRGLPAGRRACAAARPGRVDPVLAEADAAHVRARRRDRPAVDSPTTKRTAGSPACARRWRWRRPRSSRKSRFGPARPRRRGLPGRHQVEARCSALPRTRSTSPATPTKATPAPSATAW
jgi:hypothetical protein